MKVDLLREKILPSLLKLAWPLMATSFVQVTYALVDMMWLGRLGTNAVAAAGTVGTYIWLINSIMLIPKIGVSIRGSQSYGAGDYEQTKKSFRNALQYGVFLSIILSILCITFRESLIGIYNFEANVHQMGLDYFTIIALGFAFTFLNPIISACYGSMGNSLTPFKYNIIGLITNIILDPVLIFGYGPIPALGITGAAIATVFAQFVVTILFISFIIRENDLLYHANYSQAPSSDELKKITKLGIPGALSSGIQAIVTMVLNKFTSIYGSMPIAVYSVGSQVESISWLTSEGFASAITAFAGQNFGARKFDRIREMAKKSLSMMFAAGTVVMLAFIFFGNEIFNIFLPNDPEAVKLGVKYFIILGVSQPLMNIETGSSGVFNGIGQTRFPGVAGSLLNLLRIPMALFFMRYFGVLGIWMSMSISSILKGLVFYLVLRGRLNDLELEFE